MGELNGDVKNEIREFLVSERDATTIKTEGFLKWAGLGISILGLGIIGSLGAGAYFIFERAVDLAVDSQLEQKLSGSRLLEYQAEALDAVVTARSQSVSAITYATKLNKDAEILENRMLTFNTTYSEAIEALQQGAAVIKIGDNLNDLVKDKQFLATVRGEINPVQIGMVAAFIRADDLSSCPKGWRVFSEGYGRTIVGAGPATETSKTRSPLEIFGQETIKLSTNQLAPHSHAMLANSGAGAKRYPRAGEAVAMAANVRDGGLQNANFEYQTRPGKGKAVLGATSVVGKGVPVDLMQPSIALYYCVKL